MRHYYGAEGQGARHATNAETPDKPSAVALYEQADGSHNPSRLAAWCEFHQQVERLPEEEREVYELIYYHQLGHTEAATLLEVSARTVSAATRLLACICMKPWEGSCQDSDPQSKGVVAWGTANR